VRLGREFDALRVAFLWVLSFGEAKVKYLDGGARPAKLHFPLISKGKTVMETAHADTKPVFTVMVKMTGMGRIENRHRSGQPQPHHRVNKKRSRQITQAWPDARSKTHPFHCAISRLQITQSCSHQVVYYHRIT
jgi:hypothetical protein